jgi:hypothetical protein
MQPNYVPLVQLFGAPARYTVPLFQRPYVWEKDEQWEPLWIDIVELADRVLATANGDKVAGHFLGTVVLEQAISPTDSIARREIIDGQQRLTTLQVVLKACEHALSKVAAQAEAAGRQESGKAAKIAAKQLSILTFNAAFADEEEKFKIWPTNDDRAAFSEVMNAWTPDELQGKTTRLAEAYQFFFDSAYKWLGGGQHEERRSAALASALQKHLRLIVLDLDDTDEPQAIFETLNAQGVPLLPADLIKNWLLWEAGRQKIANTRALYENYWLPFDADPAYWRVRIGTGHAARPRVDTFLQNWLTRRTIDVIPVKHLYDRFRRFAAPYEADGKPPIACDLPALMADIHGDGKRYREIDEPTGQSRFHTFLRRLAMIDIAVFHPLLLMLMGRPGSDQADRDAAAEALESYLVRRIVCWEQTRAYALVMLDLLKAISALDPSVPAAPTLIDWLATKPPEAYRWPDDAKFQRSWTNNKFYGGYRRSRVLMILQALEEHYLRAGTKGEPIVSVDYSSLEIEHILPQEWKHHWPLPEGDKAREERDDRINRIGNLTLISGKLNKGLSNAAWRYADEGKKGKRDGLDDHSKLQLNARLLKKHPTAWTEASIDARGEELFEAARLIWPAAPASGAPA